MIETAFFIHVPKTAGTSFTHALERTFSHDRLAWDYGARSPRTTPWVRTHVYESPDRERFVDELLSRRVVVLGGHVGWPHYGDVFSPQRTIAFVRDPVERMVSEWCDRDRVRSGQRHSLGPVASRIAAVLRRLPGGASRAVFAGRGDLTWEGLESFAAGTARNVQSRMLGGVSLTAYGALGVTSHYREALELVRRRFGWDVPHLTANVNPGKPLGDSYRLPEDLARRIRSVNAKDVELVERVQELFGEAISGFAGRLH